MPSGLCEAERGGHPHAAGRELGSFPTIASRIGGLGSRSRSVASDKRRGHVLVAAANVRFCLPFWFPDSGSNYARSEGARMPSVHAYAGGCICQNADDLSHCGRDLGSAVEGTADRSNLRSHFSSFGYPLAYSSCGMQDTRDVELQTISGLHASTLERNIMPSPAGMCFSSWNMWRPSICRLSCAA